MQDAVTDFIINRITASLQTMSNSSEEEMAWSRVGRAALKFETAFPLLTKKRVESERLTRALH